MVEMTTGSARGHTRTRRCALSTYLSVTFSKRASTSKEELDSSPSEAASASGCNFSAE